MNDKFYYIKIALPKTKTDSFYYKSSIDISINIGDYVRVPFRNSEIIGIVIAIDNPDIAIDKIREIICKIDINPVNLDFIKFINFVSNYTLYNIGDIMKMAIPIDIVKKHINHQDCKQIPTLKLKELSEEQIFVVDFIQEKINKKSYNTILLNGVTGSGKTEVYFTVIKNILENNNGQILILLPEIILTSQLIDRFINRFGFTPSIWHSDISIKNKRKTWHEINNNQARIIIGARSALFLPFNNLSLIIVDEEHDSSYKQEEGVIYQTRDMAIMRACKENITILLSSATPSIETIYNIKKGRFFEVKLEKRYSNISMPVVDIIDMRKETLQKNHWISESLKESIIDTVNSGKQVMLFLNRKGYAPLTLCKSCGYRFICNNCSSWLVEYKYKSKLQCNHCNISIYKPKKCPNCDEDDSLIACGPGVERIAEEVASIDENFKIITITKDDLSDIESTMKILNDIENNKYNIIIGTQIIAKGLHFPNLILVGIIDSDITLPGGDLRASEKTLQLLNQLGGRAGREKIRGKVIIQSFDPNNPIMKSLENNDLDGFIDAEIENRLDAMMPPFTKLAAIILSGYDENKVIQYSDNLVRIAPIDRSVKIYGPVPAILSKVRNRYRYRILIKSEKHINIQKYIKTWFKSIKQSNLVKIKIDIDPYNFY